MPVTAESRVAAVIGSPIRHSMSPVIHNAAFAACGVDGVYVALPVPAGRSHEAVAAMRLFDWFGFSVTMPHKQDVAAACDELTEAADVLGAVNCVYWSDGQIMGDNTDGDGFVRGLASDLSVDPQGLRCAVVGAGGAAKAVIRALAAAGANQVTVVNRNQSRAEDAAALAGTAGAVGSFDSLAEADLVVNATPIGMAGTDHEGGLPFEIATLAPDAVLSDLIYHPAETPLLKAARVRGLRCQNGLPMLVFQAAVQFERWTNVAAPIDTMSAAVADALHS